MDCTSCKRRSEYEFVKEFVIRENNLLIQVANHQQVIQNLGNANQRERVCLNTLQTNFDRFQATHKAAFQESEAARVKYEKECQDLKVEYSVVQDKLRLEKQAHDDLRQAMEGQWKSVNSLAAQLQSLEDTEHDVIADNKAKAEKIRHLEVVLKEKEQKVEMEGIYRLSLEQKIDDLEAEVHLKDGQITYLEEKLRESIEAHDKPSRRVTRKRSSNPES